jgi:hypothetical protein
VLVRNDDPRQIPKGNIKLLQVVRERSDSDASVDQQRNRAGFNERGVSRRSTGERMHGKRCAGHGDILPQPDMKEPDGGG